MPLSFSRFSLILLASTAAFSAPAHADFVGVSRCAVADGLNTLALHIIEGGDRYLIPIGQDGLTHDVVFNERRALAWVAASGLFPADTVFGNYDSYICGLLNEDAEEASEVVTAPPPPPPPQPECEGEGCQVPQ